LSDAGRKNMERKTPRWESELWSYLCSGDGTNCPVYPSCHLRGDNVRCFGENEKYFKLMNEFVDEDEPELNTLSISKFEFPKCHRSGRIFRLVGRLANRYQEEAGIGRLPVPTDLITQDCNHLPIEVRRVPLKANHGAVWQLSDCWLVHLNSNDTPARQRFTLYHEIFHILAHYKGTPVFKKTGHSHEGAFNELLADHFAGVILTPPELVRKTWPEVKDISQMAAIFNVPKPVLWIALKGLRLI
jgi:hypothetical protein